MQTHNSVTTQRYIYGMPAERLFAQQNTTKTWYRVDALNSVRALLDAAGLLQDVASYDAWGVPETAAIAPFGFTGELQRGNDVWLRARWYGAGRGGFGGRDPWAGDLESPQSLNQYIYVQDDPLNCTDPTGQKRLRIWVAAFIAPNEIVFPYIKATVIPLPPTASYVCYPFVDANARWHGDNRTFSHGQYNRFHPRGRLWHELSLKPIHRNIWSSLIDLTQVEPM